MSEFDRLSGITQALEQSTTAHEAIASISRRISDSLDQWLTEALAKHDLTPEQVEAMPEAQRPRLYTHNAYDGLSYYFLIPLDNSWCEPVILGVGRTVPEGQQPPHGLVRGVMREAAQRQEQVSRGRP